MLDSVFFTPDACDGAQASGDANRGETLAGFLLALPLWRAAWSEKETENVRNPGLSQVMMWRPRFFVQRPALQYFSNST
jgi:hypothetical protein